MAFKVRDRIVAMANIPLGSDTWVIPHGRGGEIVAIDDDGIAVAFDNTGFVLTRFDWSGFIVPAPVASEPAAERGADGVPFDTITTSGETQRVVWVLDRDNIHGLFVSVGVVERKNAEIEALKAMVATMEETIKAKDAYIAARLTEIEALKSERDALAAALGDVLTHVTFTKDEQWQSVGVERSGESIVWYSMIDAHLKFVNAMFAAQQALSAIGKATS